MSFILKYYIRIFGKILWGILRWCTCCLQGNHALPEEFSKKYSYEIKDIKYNQEAWMSFISFCKTNVTFSILRWCTSRQQWNNGVTSLDYLACIKSRTDSYNRPPNRYTTKQQTMKGAGQHFERLFKNTGLCIHCLAIKYHVKAYKKIIFHPSWVAAKPPRKAIIHHQPTSHHSHLFPILGCRWSLLLIPGSFSGELGSHSQAAAVFLFPPSVTSNDGCCSHCYLPLLQWNHPLPLIWSWRPRTSPAPWTLCPRNRWRPVCPADPLSTMTYVINSFLLTGTVPTSLKSATINPKFLITFVCCC